MESIDATDRDLGSSSAITPASLLTVILDTNPVQWDLLSSTLSLSQAISNLLIFINAHLAINGANQVAILAAHPDRMAWLYPTPDTTSKVNRVQNGEALLDENAHKYRPFLAIEQELLANLRALMADTSVEALAAGANATQIAGSLTSALTYTNQQSLQMDPPRDGMNAGAEISLQATQSGIKSDAKKLVSRILVVSVSSDRSDQYISVMNSIFAAQRLRIPIDVLKLAGSTVFLQQASDATEGIYLAPEIDDLKGSNSLLQYLMMGYLPDVTARQSLNVPGKTEVDFRAACFCHREVADIGYVCSVCLSIFCNRAIPLSDNQCLTCHTFLNMPVNWNVQPALIPKKKVKKKRAMDVPSSSANTPHGGTPI